MPYEEPTPPPEVPREIAEALGDDDPATLRAVADYAEALAEFREREDRSREGADEDVTGATADDDGAERADDRPDDVPSKASITVKEINDNRYYYWQWREGERIKSKYEGPVGPE